MSTLVLVAMALTAAGYAAYLLQRSRVLERIDQDLATSAEEFRVLSVEGVDPDTGAPFDSAEDLMRVAMERSIPGRNEGLVGVVDGSITLSSTVAPVALEDDPQIVALVADMESPDRATVSTVETDTTSYRLGVLPIGTEDSSSFTGIVLAYDLEAESAEFSAVFRTYAIVAGISLAAVAGIGWLVAGRLLRPVRVLASTAQSIGRSDLSERIPVEGADDMADMTRSVNAMLDRLEGAFAAQRSVMDDVSHELRTPLTVIRGHLEVMAADQPEDVEDTRRLVLDEIDRMSRVVDDLTTLALTDQPGFVTVAPVSLGTLTDDTLDRVSRLGSHAWEVGMRSGATIVADRQRLLQAWLQLAANASKYSEPASRIVIGSDVSGGEARLWVEDEGIGIEPSQLEEIFTRFRRAAPEAAHGAGLGLSIVSAIAEAHGGRVDVSSTLGQGSIFTIIVPSGTERSQE